MTKRSKANKVFFKRGKTKMSDQEQNNPSEDGQTDPQKQPDILEQVLEADLKHLQEERDVLFERLARVTADFKNAQKRLEEDKRQGIEYANSQLITAILPVIDNFERFLCVDPEKVDVPAILKGMQIVHDQWLAVLKGQNVEQIAPEPGALFDPTFHSALMQQDTEQYKDIQDTVVTLLVQKGYAMRGRVLRPAHVAVNRLQG